MADLASISDPNRLASLRQTQLLDTPAEQSFDRITNLAAKLLGAPVSMVSLIDADRQFFKSCVGLPAPLDTQRQMPLSYSVCQYVVDSGELLRIDDARSHPLLRDHPIVRDFGVAAYLGAPLTGPNDQFIGALCVIDVVPRTWTAEQLKTLLDLAAFVVTEITARTTSRLERARDAELQRTLELLRRKQAEAAFEKQFRFLADAMPQIVWTAKPTGEVDYYNNRWFEYTGMTLEQTRDWGWKTVLHPDDLQDAIDKWTAAFTNEKSYEGEFRFKSAKDGTYRWHLVRGVAMRGADGSVMRWVGTSTDIDEQRKITAALEDARNQMEHRVQERTAQLSEQQQFLQAVLDNIGDGIIACDPTGKLTVFNRALRNMAGGTDGMRPEEFAKSYVVYQLDGKTLLPDEQRPLRKALAGQTVVNEESLVSINGSKQLRRMLSSGGKIVDGNRKTVGAVLAVHDITERAAAENRFRLIFDSSPDAHLIHDESGVLDCNPAVLRLLGLQSKQQLTGQHPAVYSPEYQPDGRLSEEKRIEMDQIARRDGSHRFEWVHRRLDGTNVPTEMTLTAVELNGKPALLAVSYDLTERKRAEESLRATHSELAKANFALKQSEERFTTFMDMSPVASFITDENSRLLYVNRRYAEIFNRTPKSLLGQSPFDYFPPDAAARMIELDKQVLRSNQAIEASSLPTFPGGESDQWMLLKFPLQASNGGRLIGGIAVDVSIAKKAEAELARRKQFFEAVIENASDGIIACDQNGEITCMNRAIRSMQGVARVPEQVTRDWFITQLALYDPVSGNRLEWDERPISRALRNETVSDVELLVRPPGGPQRTIVVSACPIVGQQGQILGAVAAWHDVTDLRRSQNELISARDAADAANLAKSEFLANMSHEIRTPMTAIMGYTDLLDDPGLNRHQRAEHIHVIRRNGQHLLELISDVLDLSKIEAGEVTLEMLAVDPIQLLCEVETVMKPRAAAKGISLTMLTSAEIPKLILTDPTRLKQILLNLVGNAVKFTESGGVRVSLDVDDQQMLRFDVTDTGIGIAPDNQAKLFHPFRQADSSMTRRFGGTGLGLAISKRLARILDGELSLTSGLGKGSTFSLVLPLRLPAAPFGAVKPVPHFPAATMGDIRLHGRILVAEDGLDNQRLVRLYLEAAGLAVETAANGRIAVDAVEENARKGTPFDAVLMDMQMPEMDGYTAAAELRRMRYADLPIVAFTAHAMTGERERCIKCGCNDYVTKPINRQHLLGVLANFLPALETNTTGPLRSDKTTDPLISTILGDYVNGLPEQIAKVSRHLATADLRSLRIIMHQMKGSGGSYGFPDITSRARSAEAAITAKEPMDRIVQEVQSLVDLVRRVEGYDQSKEQKLAAPLPG